eukprot:7627204-Pyramimonas_sp.AAC.1
MIPRPPKAPTRTETPARQRGLRDALGSVQRSVPRRPRWSRNTARGPARASAAATMCEATLIGHRAPPHGFCISSCEWV